ncbi:MAG: ATP-binding protein [Lachnospiraceae bacterium]|nr:ATP-binding protein [Lachnospiraceae bacterium]
MVTDYIEEKLSGTDCPVKILNHILISAEEVFVNIAQYAYGSGQGTASIKAEFEGDPVTIILTFMDNGMKYDPLAKDDPDVSIPLKERKKGGMGIFMTKKMMDDVSYEYRDGKNILILKKNIQDKG